MWSKPWTMKEGFLIGGGLIFAGLMLELSVGPVVWETFAWPINGIVLAGFMVMLTAMVLFAQESICLPVPEHVSGDNTCDGVCRGADHHHGTDTTASKRHMAEQHAVILAVRTYLCVYHGDSGTHHPSQITSNIQR